jgi:hypothetical protein
MTTATLDATSSEVLAAPDWSPAPFPFTVGRTWLEYRGLDHLLPDPHTHWHIYACVDQHYEGGAAAFQAAITERAMVCLSSTRRALTLAGGPFH